jgi:hypothetical protein
MLRRVRRSIAKARSLVPGVDDYRRALLLMSEIRGQIQSLNERLRLVEEEINASTRRVVAVNAYNRCAALGRRQTAVRNERAKS